MHQKNRQLFLGTMSGTSLDGLDLAAVEFNDHLPQLLYSQTIPYPVKLQESLRDLALNSKVTIDQMCSLDTQLGHFYANSINAFLNTHQISPQQITAIGSHGQTIRHNTQQPTPYTLQIGDPNIIVAETGVTVVADFRRRDLAHGGQGAPLAPAFHNEVFRSNSSSRIIINIGGIANITHLPSDAAQPVSGFDTGPGNTLLDFLSQQFLNKDYDKNGALARNGKPNTELLHSILEQEPYFHKSAPKSTGTDYFSPTWFNRQQLNKLAVPDAMATLVELTAISIAKGIHSIQDNIEECFVCGGGAHNNFMLERLDLHLGSIKLKSTLQLGIHPDWVEAMAFAWLARQTILLFPGNLPSVTNAKIPTILGGVYFSHRQT